MAVFVPLMGWDKKASDGHAWNGLCLYLLTITPLLGYWVLTEWLASGIWKEAIWVPYAIVGVPLAGGILFWGTE